MNIKPTLQIAAIQTMLHWEDRIANLKQIDGHLALLDPSMVDMIVLPEMFTTGFTMNAVSFAEVSEGETLNWMVQKAAHFQSAITGSLIVQENMKYFNRMYFVYPDGSYLSYDKRHTFSYAGEDKVISAGHRRIIVEYNGWRICPLICYDLRFPVWSRNTEEYDLLVYVANWPSKRIVAWDTLLPARAVENISYCIGVNRIGQDGNGLEYNGHSGVYDPLGEKLTNVEEGKEQIIQQKLDRTHLMEVRSKYRFLQDRDNFEIE